MTQLELTPGKLRPGMLVRIPHASTFRIAAVVDFGRVVISDRPLGPGVAFRRAPDQWRYVADGLEMVEP
jgi:hypothetical protein